MFEVSRTIRLDDVTESTRAGPLPVAAATGEPTIAAVVGETIQPPQQQRQADEVGVKVLLPPMLRQQTQSADETADPIC